MVGQTSDGWAQCLGDGLLLCARYAKGYRGAVYIWRGGRGFDGNRPADVVLVAEKRSNMGGDDIACGYSNGDRYGDILVGAFSYPRPPFSNGRAYLFHGNDGALMDTVSM
jgi:hypothetical protein